jgi:hypothetical protein
MASLKLIFGLGIIGAALFVCFRLIPPYFSNYELQDAIKTESVQSTYSTRTEDDIRAAVIKHARDYDIELTPKQVHVVRNGGVGNGSLTIDVEYSVQLDLPGYSTELDFHPSSKNTGVY